MNYFNDIISDSEHFIDMPDCIVDGGSYQETLEKAINLTPGILSLEDFQWTQNGKQYDITLKVNGATHQFSVDIVSDYIDSKNTIAGLNQILLASGHTGERRFCDINGGAADFGIAFITKEKEAELAQQGLIWREE